MKCHLKNEKKIKKIRFKVYILNTVFKLCKRRYEWNFSSPKLVENDLILKNKQNMKFAKMASKNVFLFLNLLILYLSLPNCLCGTIHDEKYFCVSSDNPSVSRYLVFTPNRSIFERLINSIFETSEKIQGVYAKSLHFSNMNYRSF